MRTHLNALAHADPLLQTVAQADARQHALLECPRGPVRTSRAQTPDFRMVCQPICRVTGRGGPAWVEMLIRGKGPFAQMSPMDIVQRGYDRAGLEFDLTVLDAALAAAGRLRPTTRLGVNIRPCTLNEPGFIRALKAMLVRRRIAPDRLVLELVEFHGPVRLALARRTLHQLRRMHVMVALDDFGPGHPNLDVLAEGLVDFVKLDRSLVSALGRSAGHTGVLQGIAALAAKTGITLVAEGIETPAQLIALRRLGIEWMQGFLLGRPAALAGRPNAGGDATVRNPRAAGSASPANARNPLTTREYRT